MGLAVFTVASLFSLPAFAGQTITVVERATTDTVVDTGPKGDSVGDILTFANSVYDAANRNKIGTDQGHCMRVIAGKSWECFWTMNLKDGQITVEGPFYDAADSVMAVTGGTGKYVGAKGSMALHDRKSKEQSYDFKYALQ
jgi:hypothetical protein